MKYNLYRILYLIIYKVWWITQIKKYSIIQHPRNFLVLLSHYPFPLSRVTAYFDIVRFTMSLSIVVVSVANILLQHIFALCKHTIHYSFPLDYFPAYTHLLGIQQKWNCWIIRFCLLHCSKYYHTVCQECCVIIQLFFRVPFVQHPY